MKLAHRDSEAGFSLLELLVVLVIIGLMSASVVLSMRAPAPTQESYQETLLGQLNQTSKAAIYTGRVHALSASEAGLHLMIYANREWVVQRDFTSNDIGLGQLHIEGEKIDLPEEVAPLILFEPTGEITDFTLGLNGAGQDVVLTVSEAGALIFERKS
ncbi:MAG: prepilin-type N-terminal cleavage/methylation domain-containing protein [Maricaulaceae bacterium]